MKKPRRALLGKILLRAVLLLVALLGGEVLLRVAGQRPFQPRGATLAQRGIPRVTVPHHVQGWVNEPGSYLLPVLPGQPPDSGGTPMRVWEDGSRATAPERRPSDRRVLLVGGSFTFGWAIRDEETFAFRLQERFPGHEFVNFGTNAYGAYQSLLRVERYFADGEASPELVIYGLMGSHPRRDVAEASWQLQLATSSQSKSVAIPWCSLDEDGGLVRQPPQSYPVWTGSRSLALVAALQDAYAHWRASDRRATADRVTLESIAEMGRLVRQNGGQLLVAVLTIRSPEQMDAYVRFLDEHGIAHVRCVDKRLTDPAMQVPGDGHPNGLMNAIWADKLEAALRTLID